MHTSRINSKTHTTAERWNELCNGAINSPINYFILQIYKYTTKSIFDKWKGVTNTDERGIILEFSLFYKDKHLFHAICSLKNFLQIYFVALINWHVYDKFILAIFILYASNAFFFCLKIIKFQHNK